MKAKPRSREWAAIIRGAANADGFARILKRRKGRADLGGWYLSLGGCLMLIFIGLYTHWIVIACGAVLPFVPLVIHLLQRRRDS
jgi:hypothetical protein